MVRVGVVVRVRVVIERTGASGLRIGGGEREGREEEGGEG